MDDSLLTILKFLLVALIYLFFFRVLRAVWAEVQSRTDGATEGRPARSGTGAGAGATTGRPERRAPAARLKIIEPKARKGLAFPIGDEITVGRAPGCGVKLDEDIAVSQLHARIFQRDGQYHVEDLGSRNGTHVYRKGTRNAEQVTGTTLLRPGDMLAVGQTLMELTK